jgi:hypothetical protein
VTLLFAQRKKEISITHKLNPNPASDRVILLQCRKNQHMSNSSLLIFQKDFFHAENMSHNELLVASGHSFCSVFFSFCEEKNRANIYIASLAS